MEPPCQGSDREADFSFESTSHPVAGEDLLEGLSVLDGEGEMSTPMEVQAATPKKKSRELLAEQESEIAELRAKVAALEKESRKEAKVSPLKINPPALFNGKRGTWEYFASKLLSYAELCLVPTHKVVALAVQQLDEKPTKVWEAYRKKLAREGGVVTWDVFNKFMSSRYDSSDLVSIARQKLDKVYQGSEGVERFIERFTSLLADVETEYDMCEQDKIHLFTKGLETPLRMACTVNPATGRPFTDLDTLCTYVVRYETSLKAAGGARGTSGQVAPKRYSRPHAVHLGGQPPHHLHLHSSHTPPATCLGRRQVAVAGVLNTDPSHVIPI
jgi:hypothetical protein